MGRRPSSVITSAVAIALFAIAASTVHAQASTEFDLPAQALANSLRAVGKRADMNILIDRRLIAGLQAPALKAQLTFEEAITRLLSGTGLTYQFVDERTVTITSIQRKHPDGKVPATQNAAPAPSTSSVQGTNGDTHLAQAEPAESAAQAATNSTQRVGDASGPQDVGIDLGEIIVTGTNIRGVTPDFSPLTIYDREDIERSGAGSVGEFVRRIPQNFSKVDGSTFLTDQTTQNFAFGTGIDLRGLGAGSTLVLLNGHRLAPSGQGGSFVDVSLLPLSVIEQVDVLTDGASAIYGADAVGGVVNFRLRRAYEGVETTLRHGWATRGGLDQLTGSLLAGNNWTRGNALLVYEHDDQDGLRAGERDFVPDQVIDSAQFVPEQERDSVFASLRQDVAERSEVFLDLFHSERDYALAATVTPGLPELELIEGAAKQSGVAAGLTQEMSANWGLSLVANFARARESRTTRRVNQPLFNGGGIRSEIRSLDLLADGPMFSLAGGPVRASLGGSFRQESFDDFVRFQSNAGDGLERDVKSLFAELLIPIVGQDNARPGAQRFELSLAARHDDYDDVGSSTDPKIGLSWAPVAGLKLRASFATSFRVPSLPQLSDVGRSYIIFPLNDSGGGLNNTLLLSATGNSALGPEESESFTAGFDLTPASLPGLRFSATWFDIDYTRRIAGPPIVGSVFDIFLEMDTLAPFFDLSPDLAAIQQEIDSGAAELNDFLGIGLQNATALFDFRVKNLARNEISGLELAVDYDFSADAGDIGLSLAGDYLSTFDFRSTAATPSTSLVNKVFRPMDLKLRGGATWSRGRWGSALFVNYAAGYENNLLTPVGRVDSWTTADLQLSYDADSSGGTRGLQGVRAVLSVLNLLDEDPPALPSGGALFFDFGYDVANAVPNGRVVSLQISKRW